MTKEPVSVEDVANHKWRAGAGLIYDGEKFIRVAPGLETMQMLQMFKHYVPMSEVQPLLDALSRLLKFVDTDGNSIEDVEIERCKDALTTFTKNRER